MKLMILAILMALTLSIIMMLLASILSKKTFKDREKTSPFECGFDPKSSPRIPFSLQFFLIAVIFLIFDVEITLLMPMVMTMKLSLHVQWIYSISFFVIVLLYGLYHEWIQGALNWSK
uniref:NADH-ubiquinone oxidoreductase chain 3 n=1 Tax=Rhysodes sp. BMNH-844233 TaxID=1909167 RepID=A0A343A4C4_9CARA|nr:NADH dehydrogenase subunit 3 [Rhysodes sp. BMNH-844233]